MDKTAEWLVIAIAAVVWAFFLLTPLGRAFLEVVLNFYGHYV